MKYLIILRHAQARSGSPDFERQLSHRGEQQTITITQTLKLQRYTPDQIICSDAVRTRQTAERVANGLDIPRTAIDKQAQLYNAPWETLLQSIAKADETATTLMIVAHNPGISMLASMLLLPNAATIFNGLGTAGLLTLEFKIDYWSLLSPHTGAPLLIQASCQ